MLFNPAVEMLKTEVLSDNWYVLRKLTFRLRKQNGEWETQSREAYDRGNGAAILLYDTEGGTVVLTRQFRAPTFVNGNPTGMMIEACAGLLDRDSPEQCIVKEAREETGYEVRNARKIFEAYMSPGSVTEILYFFIAQYSHTDRVSSGGGIAEEQENIEVLEMKFTDALAKIASGDIKDAKTIMLLYHLKIAGIM